MLPPRMRDISRREAFSGAAVEKAGWAVSEAEKNMESLGARDRVAASLVSAHCRLCSPRLAIEHEVRVSGQGP